MTQNQGIVFIVNGEDVQVPISDDEVSLAWLVALALKKSYNTSRKHREWEVRDCNGALLDTTRTAADYRWSNEKRWPRLFLNLKIGAGGNWLTHPTAVYAPTTNVLPFGQFIWWP